MFNSHFIGIIGTIFYIDTPVHLTVMGILLVIYYHAKLKLANNQTIIKHETLEYLLRYSYDIVVATSGFQPELTLSTMIPVFSLLILGACYFSVRFALNGYLSVKLSLYFYLYDTKLGKQAISDQLDHYIDSFMVSSIATAREFTALLGTKHWIQIYYTTFINSDWIGITVALIVTTMIDTIDLIRFNRHSLNQFVDTSKTLTTLFELKNGASQKLGD